MNADISLLDSFEYIDERTLNEGGAAGTHGVSGLDTTQLLLRPQTISSGGRTLARHLANIA
jgi:hypothetical protein